MLSSSIGEDQKEVSDREKRWRFMAEQYTCPSVLWQKFTRYGRGPPVPAPPGYGKATAVFKMTAT